MPRFEYVGTDERGAAARGELEAGGLIEAADLLRTRGVWVSSLQRKEAGADPALLESADAFAYFNRSLAELAGMGLTLPRAIRAIASGMRRGRFKDALATVEGRLRDGVPFEEAVRELPGVFPPHYAWMIRAGASSGSLPAVLSAVARNAEGARRVRQALSGALAYPALVAAFALLFSASFLWVYLPMYEDLHLRLGLEPAFSVKALLAVFRSRVGAGLLAGGAVLAGVFGYLWATRSLAGERALLRAPLLGRVLRQLTLARFAGALSILLRAKVPVVRAYPVALGASGSRILGAAAGTLAARAEEGAGLAELLRETPVLPPSSAGYLALGEKSGRAADAAAELADLMTERAAAESETLFIVLVPAAIVATGLLLLALFIGLVAPYYSLLERIGP